MQNNDTVPVGRCQCGCGKATALATRTDNRHGHLKGSPFRFLLGHQRPRPAVSYVVHPETGCWVWQGKITHGYAYVCRSGKTLRAARDSYERTKGAIPEGLQIDHLCRNRACVNPDHLEAVTQEVNVRRSTVAKLTAEDVATIRSLAETTSQRVIAERFGIHPSNISRILSGKTWR